MAAYFFARENYRYHYYSLASAVTTCFLSFYGQNMPNVVVWTLIGAQSKGHEEPRQTDGRG